MAARRKALKEIDFTIPPITGWTEGDHCRLIELNGRQCGLH